MDREAALATLMERVWKAVEATEKRTAATPAPVDHSVAEEIGNGFEALELLFDSIPNGAAVAILRAMKAYGIAVAEELTR